PPASRLTSTRPTAEQEQMRTQPEASALQCDALEAGAAAERQGDPGRALQIYTAALGESGRLGHGLPRDLAERAIDVALKLKPAPAIPDEARNSARQAEIRVRSASQPVDFEVAVKQLREALALAPWWADAYANLAALHEAGNRDLPAVVALTL